MSKPQAPASSGDRQEFAPLKIARAFDAAEGIRSFELVHPEGGSLAPFTPGSHLRVQVPSGAVRKYSLCNDPSERHRYVITVKREVNGRGGSLSLVDLAGEGDTLPSSAPENAFPLVEAAEYLFIAGGIGITPIMSMIRSFGELPPAPWRLYYCTRARESTAFYEELSREYPGRVHFHHDHGDPAQCIDLWPLLGRPSRAHIYCCGPRGLMEAVRDMTGHWSHSSIHFESFNEGGVARAEDRAFTVRLPRSGKTLEVPVGKTILEVVREAGVAVAYSCESGTCGTCRTRLLAGEADHRDWVLMPEEAAREIMICVSRAKSAELVLDL